MKILSSECTNCGLCAEYCPLKAVVRPGPGERGVAPYIRTDRCTECVGHFTWPRCASLCPVGAIRRDLEHPEGRLARMAKWFALTGNDRFEQVEPPALEPSLEMGQGDA